jgi:hypothetical protein
VGASPVDNVEVAKARVVAGSLVVKGTTFDVPPPGTGFETVTEAVLGVTMSDAGTVAVNCEPLTKFVASAVPFQLTTELETN